MPKAPEAAGYIIVPKGGDADPIYGAGTTVEEAWAQVVDGVGVFYEDLDDLSPDDAFERRHTGPKEISPEEALATQFHVLPASAALVAETSAEDYSCVGGVYCTTEEAEAFAEAMEDEAADDGEAS